MATDLAIDAGLHNICHSTVANILLSLQLKPKLHWKTIMMKSVLLFFLKLSGN